MAIASSAADANAMAGPERHIRCHQRGSKILSETKAIRCGTSSSLSESSAVSVRRNRSSSSRQFWHDSICEASPGPPEGSPSAYAFKSTDEQVMTHSRFLREPKFPSGDRGQYKGAI